MHTPFHRLSTLFSIHVAKELDHDLIICLEERASWSFTASEEPCLCLILAFFRTNWQYRAPHRKHSQQCSDHLSQHTQWCLCLRALAHNLCWTQLQWFKILLISSCLSCLSPGNESMHPSCSAAAAASPTYYLKSTLATAWHQDIRLRMWKWVKAVQAEGQVKPVPGNILKPPSQFHQSCESLTEQSRGLKRALLALGNSVLKQVCVYHCSGDYFHFISNSLILYTVVEVKGILVSGNQS